MTTTTPRPYGPLKWRLPPVLVRLDDPTESLARSVSRNRPFRYSEGAGIIRTSAECERGPR